MTNISMANFLKCRYILKIFDSKMQRRRISHFWNKRYRTQAQNCLFFTQQSCFEEFQANSNITFEMHRHESMKLLDFIQTWFDKHI